MPTRSIIVTSILLLCATVGRAQAQAPAESRVVALARLRAVAESGVARESWAGTGAILGGLGGGGIFAVAFYHFSHRDGAVNRTEGNLGGTLVGAAVGAAGGALFGAFVGSLIPRHKQT